MEAVNLRFKYEQSEIVKAERQYLFASKLITKTSIAVLAVYLPFSLIYLFVSSFSFFGVAFFGIALFALITGCILYFYIPVYKFKKTAKYHEEYYLNFTEDRIEFTTPTINSLLKWDVYSELWESGNFYFLIQAPRIYTLIPKRVFQDTAKMQAFEKIALASLNHTKRTL